MERKRHARQEVPQASAGDSLRIAVQVLAPTLVRGILARRPRVVAAAERLDADRKAGRLLQRMRAKYGPGPIRLWSPLRSIALVLSEEDVRRVLEGSPEPFAVANREKRAALWHFQPHGLLTASGTDRTDRRRFNEAVLNTHRPVHQYGDLIAGKIASEAAELMAGTDTLTWDDFRVAWWRVIRRVVLGDAARDDDRVSDLLTRLRMEANWAFAPRRPQIYREFRQRLDGYVRNAEHGSLAELVATTPATGRTKPQAQMPQWLFAFEPAGMAAYCALALLATHPEQARRAYAEIEGRDLSEPQDLPFLRACVQESVRLWPTTLAILRDTTTATDWDGRTLPAHTALLIPTAFVQRDEQTLHYADTFAPDVWLDGTAQRNWAAIPFSGGPGECPGRNLVLLTTSQFLAHLLAGHAYRQTGGQRLSPDQPLPRTLNPFGLRLDVERTR
ncbi:cytochrome P450 [Actinomadura rudentiformis]|uniref:Cytochrome P450 n=2 Tax=Actinomadura rudentiformis TaxID=359158 RepID=A0A6H9YZ66_9ACTN|nr:cytochrome P450 [Actinomadura rudentiformis]